MKQLKILAAASLLALSSQAQAGLIYGLGGPTKGANVIPGLYTIDTDTGASTLIGSTGIEGIQGLAIDPATGRMYSTGGSVDGPSLGLYEIDRNTGTATSIGGSQKFIALDFSPINGMLYAQASPDYEEDDLFTIDLATGVETLVGDLQHQHLQGIAFSADGSEIFWTHSGDFSSLDPADATETGFGSIGLFLRIALGLDDVLYASGFGGNDDTNLYTIDTGAITRTVVADTGNYFFGLTAGRPSSVPEPTTFMLLAAGGLLTSFRKRKQF